MPLQVDTVFVWVTDLDVSLTWYTTVGFEPGELYGTWHRGRPVRHVRRTARRPT